MPWSDSLHSPSDDFSNYTSLDFGASSGSPSRYYTPSPRAPRLTSPRLLRELFSAQNPNSALPQPVVYQENLRTVEHGVYDDNMPVRSASRALGSGRTTQNNTNNVVDLTNSSDDPSEDAFMTQTRHPHDSSRPVRPANSMNEPAYGLQTLGSHAANHTAINQPHSIDNQIPSFQPLLEASRNIHVHHNTNQGHMQTIRLQPANADASAVRRQRQARRAWERVERRNRERAQQQAQRDAQERAQRDQARQADTQQPSSTSHSQHRSPNDSDAGSESDFSALSLDSDSETSVVGGNARVNRTSNVPETAVDLTTVDDSKNLTDFLAKEQQDAILAQAKSLHNHDNANTSSLSNYKCAICMDSPTNATTTICGHLFCHRCILDSLKWSERRRREEHPPQRRIQGLCPVCRKPLQNKEVGTSGRGLTGGLVTLEIKRVSRKQHTDNKARERFLESIEIQEKGKQRAQTSEAEIEDDKVPDVKKDADEEDGKVLGLALSRGRRKRKRGHEVARRSESVDHDSLFGSPLTLHE